MSLYELHAKTDKICNSFPPPASFLRRVSQDKARLPHELQRIKPVQDFRKLCLELFLRPQTK